MAKWPECQIASEILLFLSVRAGFGIAPPTNRIDSPGRTDERPTPYDKRRRGRQTVS